MRSMSANMFKNKILKILNLKCNYLKNPIGVETPNPLFSWMLQSNERGQYQKAYRIKVASSLEFLNTDLPDFWDTGKVESDLSIHIPYSGKILESRQKVFWIVCVWDSSNKESVWSEVATFEMGLLNKEDWKAKWIGSPNGGTEITKAVPAPILRKAIQLKEKVVSARVYLCGLGYYELYINGRKIGDEVLSTAFTRYDETVLYNTYDVTEAFQQGENVISAILGNGWYNCFTSEVWDFRQAAWRHQPKIIAQLHLKFDDGEELVVISDSSWKVSDSPISFDGLRNGEFYDARLEKAGWNQPGFDDDLWLRASIIRSPGGVLKSFQMAPIKVTGTIRPVRLKEVEQGVWIFDLGQNISGWAQIKVSGLAGTEVTLKYAEKIKADGSIDISNIDQFIKSGEFQTDKYVLKGEGTESWEPRFTYHGFQYIQVTGFPGIPTLDNLSGRVVHTAFEARGNFECSNQLLNSIQRCTNWSTLTNYHGIPTDCPQREKNGWTGDAYLSAEQVLFNFDPMTAYTKWLKDFKDVQRPNGQLPGIVPTGGWGFNGGSGPAWDSAMILIPWYMYEYCGDKSILEEMYDNMKLYVNYMLEMSEGFLVDFGLGDWCPPSGEIKCPTMVTDTSYFYVDTCIISKTAALLKKDKDAAKYKELAKNIRDAFRRKFLNTKTGEVEGNCQTSLSCALYQGLVDEGEKSLVLKKLIEEVEKQDRHIDCGILGTKYMLHTLTNLGRTDLAYAIATQETFPGWGHWIMQGATTLWEQWNGNDSRNHHMFSDISAWFYRGLAGINPDINEPGFKHIIFRPNPVEGLEWVKSSHQSMFGRIECNWKVEGDKFLINVSLPVNSRATLCLPYGYGENILENGNPPVGVKMEKENRDGIILSFGSGEYKFQVGKSM